MLLFSTNAAYPTHVCVQVLPRVVPDGRSGGRVPCCGGVSSQRLGGSSDRPSRIAARVPSYR